MNFNGSINGHDGDINKSQDSFSNTQIYYHWNWHNTTLLFNFIIPSCTIWYCIIWSKNAYWEAVAFQDSIHSIQDFAHIWYNHKLIYANAQDAITNSTEGDSNNYSDSNKIRYYNYHNTTLLFSNSRLLKKCN